MPPFIVQLDLLTHPSKLSPAQKIPAPEIPDWTPLELSHISCDPNKDSFQILSVGIGPLNCLQPGSDFSIPPCHPSTWPPGLESQRHAPGRQVPDLKEPTMLWG